MKSALPVPCREPLGLTIEAVRDEPGIVRALRRASELAHVAAATPDSARAAYRLGAALRGADAVSTLAILHALGGVDDPAAARVLVHTVREAQPTYAAHAAWALRSHGASAPARDALVALRARGGLGGMLAARTLRHWQPGARRRMVARDGAQGVVVLQPFLHARLDRTGSGLGMGDAGGIASLLRSLGTSLALQRDVARVVTVTRGRPGESAREELAAGHWVERIPFGPDAPLPQREAWVYDAQIESELQALGESFASRRVVWHLRMADVGSLAAAAVARRLGQPFVFTAAPDPHTEIQALQAEGQLDRARFLHADRQHNYWFRARLVERLTSQADRLALLPRPTIRRELVDLVGVDPADLAARAVVVPEGVDLAEIDRARARLRNLGTAEVTAGILAALPPGRRHLPWLLSVGRLHPAKGMDRLARVVAADLALSARVNLVVVGGDRDHPSPDEQNTLDAIALASRRAASGVVTCTGHLPPSAVGDLLAHLVATGGIYVCASAKEEFGLAVVEALSAGAVVVAPERGGPRTYVEDGVTGVLCDTTSAAALRAAIERALGLVTSPGREVHARTRAHAELGVDRMAARLASLYRDLAPRGEHA